MHRIMYKLARIVCFFATTAVFLFKGCVPSPVHNQHYIFDVIFDEDFNPRSDSAHHRQRRGAMTGRGNSLDTWACETVIPLPDDIRAEFPLDPFYRKYTHAYGIPIISSDNTGDAAVIRACYTVRFLLADRKDIRDSMFDQYGRVGVIAKSERTTEIPEHSHLNSDFIDNRARGLGGIPSIPITTNAEENLLCLFFEDRWFLEDVLVHEFAHSIHLISLDKIDPSFSETLASVYTMAKEDNLFPNTYAISKRTEYFAEGVQSFFNVQTCTSFQDGVHNNICTRDALMDYDPRLYNLIAQVFPCKNVLVDRCETNQTLAANQVMKKNCDISATTEVPTTASTTNGTQTTDATTAPTTPSSTVDVTTAPTTPSSTVDTTTAPTTPSSTVDVTTAPTTPSSTVEVTRAPTTPNSTDSVSETSAVSVTETSTENVTQVDTGCESQPCTNAGVCIPSFNDGFSCNCTQSWTGETCEYDRNECKEKTIMQECSAKGLMCINQLDGYTCRCPFGEYKTGNMANCKQGTIYGMTILIIQYESHPAKFTNDLHNSSSVEFLAHQGRMQIALNEAFGSLPGFIDASVLSFFNGSIGVEAAVTYDSMSTVTQDDIQQIISTGTPFMGSDYKADLNNTIVQPVCMDGFCFNGGTCELSIERATSICECPFGFNGDRCEIQTVTVEMTTEQVPDSLITLVIVVMVISLIAVVICVLLIIQCLRWRRELDVKSISTGCVEGRGKYSKGSQEKVTL